MNRVDILEAVKIINNRVKTFNGKKRYLATGNLSNQGIDNFVFVDYENKPSRADLMVSKGDLILARMKATNKVFLIDCDSEDLIVSTGFLTLKPKDDFDGRYLYHYFRSRKFQQLKDRFCSGATQKAINNNSFKKLKVPHYEIEKQKKIVQIFDVTDNLRQKRKEQLALLDDYLKSVFLDMFGDPVRNDKGWNVVKLGEISNKITDGTHKTPKYKSDGITFVSAKNITLQGIDWDNVKYISDEEHTFLFKRCNPKKGDVVLTKSGSLGLAAIVDVDFEFSMFESLALVKNERSKLNSIFLRAYLNSDCKDWLYGAISKGISIRHLHLIDIKGLKIFLPPLELQNKFASIVEKVEKTKQKMRDSLEEMDNHFNALMQRYFG